MVESLANLVIWQGNWLAKWGVGKPVYWFCGWSANSNFRCGLNLKSWNHIWRIKIHDGLKTAARGRSHLLQRHMSRYRCICVLVSFQINEQGVFEYSLSSNNLKFDLVHRFIHLSNFSLKRYMYKQISNFYNSWHNSTNKLYQYAKIAYFHIEALFCPLCPPWLGQIPNFSQKVLPSPKLHHLVPKLRIMWRPPPPR